MTDYDDFFDIGSGTAAPSAKLTDLNDSVAGVVRETFKKEYTKFGEKEPQIITDPKTGQPRNRTQMVVVLDTPLRNWQGVSKVPLVDHDDPTKGVKPPSDDDGTRAIYIPEMISKAGSNGVIFAVATAMRDAGIKGGLPAGTKFYLAIVDLKDVDKGNPLKVYEAKVKAPEVGADEFNEAQAATAPPAAPAQPQAQAAPATPAPQAPAAPAAPATPAAPVQDPWSGEATPAAAAPAATSTPVPPF